jgi:hypothetical protein
MDRGALNEMVLRYQRSGEGLEQILAVVGPAIYRYPAGKYGSCEDDCGEFFLFFYPRLLRTLARFREQGKPFEWYLNSVLCWQYRVYRRSRQRQEVCWRAGSRRDFWELPDSPGVAAEEGSDAYARVFRPDRRGRVPKAADRKRLLFLSLKNVWFLDESVLPRLSQATGVETARLAAMARRLREQLCQRQVRLHRLYERRNRLFAKLILLQQELEQEIEPRYTLELSVRLARLQRSLRLVRRRIGSVSLRPTNREIAEVLRVPKGTVDTSLYWLRNRLARQERGPAREAAAERISA